MYSQRCARGGRTLRWATVAGLAVVALSFSSAVAFAADDENADDDAGSDQNAVAQAMAEGALAHSLADVAVGITGVAGPTGGTATKPVGLVHFGLARKGAATVHLERRYGDLGRANIRRRAVEDALSLLEQALG